MDRSSIIDFLSSKGDKLMAADIDALRAMLIELPIDQNAEIAAEVWEIVAMIILNPNYKGDISQDILSE